MTLVNKYSIIIQYFLSQKIPAETVLYYQTPFQLLIAVILSAQCTDKRVNFTTPALFKKFSTPAALAKSSFEEVYPYIQSISYPQNKTRYIIQTACILTEKYAQQVPDDVQVLQSLPGVGRKTAHVLLSTLYQKPVIAVDTHVFRVSRRLGLANPQAKTPLAVEKDLITHAPIAYLTKLHHWLIYHGRSICKARNPLCMDCPFQKICLFYKK